MVEAARHNEQMGNTKGCLWECRQLSRTQNEPYEMCRARRDFPIVNRLRMVSFSRADKKKCKRIVIKTKIYHKIYLGGC